MLRIVLSVVFLCMGCVPKEQPDWARAVAAYEVSLLTEADKARFLKILTKDAEAQGFHVDSATPHELKIMSEVSPITFNATVWRGKNDDESIASAMDFRDRLGRVWISFSLGQDSARSAKFRNTLVPKIKRVWPDTKSLPIMPNGAIPLTNDLVLTPAGYEVSPSAASKYRNETR